jgi:hypothetical protein
MCSGCFDARACVQDAQWHILSTGTMHVCRTYVGSHPCARVCVQDARTLDIPCRDYAHVGSGCFDVHACVQDAQRYILSTETSMCRTCVGSLRCACVRPGRTNVRYSAQGLCTRVQRLLQCASVRPGRTTVYIVHQHSACVQCSDDVASMRARCVKDARW